MTTKWLEGGNYNAAKKLIATYTHSGNKVIQPTALNLTTGIWTTAQSLNTLFGANGTTYIVVGKCVTYTSNIIPRELLEGSSYNLKVLSDTTFYIQNGTTDITSYPNVNNSTIDVTKIGFENPSITSVTVNLSSFNGLKNISFTGCGNRGRAGWSYFYVEGSHTGGAYSTAITICDGRNFSTQFQEQRVNYEPVTGIFTHQGVRSATQIWTASNGTWTTNGANEGPNRVIGAYQNFKYTGLKMEFDFTNGYTLKIYDEGGE